MIPCYPNNNKLHAYKTSHSRTDINNRYCKKLHYDKGNIVEGILPRLDKCPIINLTHEELIVVPSSSSQSVVLNQFSQGNSGDKQKSQIWLS